jgi:16S rRNA (cytosine967-C5)-methyltransferase
LTARAASPARVAALHAQVRACQRRAPGLDVLVEEAAQRVRATPTDTALAREIAFAVARHRLWLEHLLAGRLERPLQDFAPAVHEALLAGLAQYLFLDRVPVHALVDETVRLAGAQSQGARLRGLVNAVMRRLTAQPREELLPPASTPWRLRLSIPQPCADEVAAALGEAGAEAFFGASNGTAPLCLRVRPAAPQGLTERLHAEIAAVTGQRAALAQGRLVPGSVSVRARGLAPDRLSAFAEGLVTVEDEGAQAACLLALGGERPARVLDLCAAPGGKSAHLADALGADARVTACDVAVPKLRRLEATLGRLGLSGRVEVRMSAEVLADAGARFDFVLVDAPCSGLGTLRRHPEIRHRRHAEDFENLARVQYDLLAQSAPRVAPGGVLAYTVCTVGHSETAGVVDRFLVLHPEFIPAPIHESLPFDPAPLQCGPGQWRVLPQDWHCDGFFVARFRRAAA